MIKAIKRFLDREGPLKRADLDALLALTDEKREAALQSMFYEMAFQNAVSFTYEELRKQGAFSGLERDLFLQEMLIINFWMMEKVFSRYRPGMAEKMHHHYFGSLPDIADRTAALTTKFKTYNLCWDEYTGHHDEFGLKVGEFLFGKEVSYPDKIVSFWIITYVDGSIKKYRKARKQCLEAGLIHIGE